MSNQKPHVAILGSGPTGLEAALAAAERGFPFTLYEAAEGVAGQVRSWGHVQLFTPWSMNVSPRMCRNLHEAGVVIPDGEACPTGENLVDQLFEPLVRLPQLQENIRYGVKVKQVGRLGLLKQEEIGTPERATRPFRLLLEETATGRESYATADVVIDCTGNTQPNHLGDGGIAAIGEPTLGDKIFCSVPNVNRESEAWAGKKILLVGAGHSAQTALRDLLKTEETQVVWVLRRERPEWKNIEQDPLPERARLARDTAGLWAHPPERLSVNQGAVVESLNRTADDAVQVVLQRSDGSTETVTVDRVLSLTGKVGDHMLYRQLQVHECYATSGPMKLAAALMGASGGGGDCLQQTSQGAATLLNPEPGFFILGSKSFGRRNDFLMRVGWQQVDELFPLLEE